MSSLDGELDLIIAWVQSGGVTPQRISDSWHLLKDSGSLILICDWAAAYDVKPLADAAFGGERFLRNEIIWVVRRPSKGRGFTDRNATVLWYVKDPVRAPFRELSMPRSRETVRRFGDGRIVSSISARTGRRAPARIEGESTAAPLNDVWVWDEAQSCWLYDLEHLDGRHPYFGLGSTHPKLPPDQALAARLKELSGSTAAGDVAISSALW